MQPPSLRWIGMPLETAILLDGVGALFVVIGVLMLHTGLAAPGDGAPRVWGDVISGLYLLGTGLLCLVLSVVGLPYVTRR